MDVRIEASVAREPDGGERRGLGEVADRHRLEEHRQDFRLAVEQPDRRHHAVRPHGGQQPGFPVERPFRSLRPEFGQSGGGRGRCGSRCRDGRTCRPRRCAATGSAPTPCWRPATARFACVLRRGRADARRPPPRPPGRRSRSAGRSARTPVSRSRARVSRRPRSRRSRRRGRRPASCRAARQGPAAPAARPRRDARPRRHACPRAPGHVPRRHWRRRRRRPAPRPTIR